MNQKQFIALDDALASLHDFISNYGARAEDYATLEQAQYALRQNAPEIDIQTKLKEFFESQDPSKLMEALRCS
jgi:hypothetical protein